MKRVISLVLVFVIVTSLCITAFAAENEVIETSDVPVGYERISDALAAAGIEYTIENGQLMLADTAQDVVVKANDIAQDSFNEKYNLTGQRATSYPTEWVHNVRFDRVASKNFKKATESALVNTIATYGATWLILTAPISFKAVVADFVVNFIGEAYALKDEADVYYVYTYYYREYGPGWFDMNGVYYGEFENKEEVRVTGNADLTGGEVSVHIEQDTMVLPQ